MRLGLLGQRRLSVHNCNMSKIVSWVAGCGNFKTSAIIIILSQMRIMLSKWNFFYWSLPSVRIVSTLNIDKIFNYESVKNIWVTLKKDKCNNGVNQNKYNFQDWKNNLTKELHKFVDWMGLRVGIFCWQWLDCIMWEMLN